MDKPLKVYVVEDSPLLRDRVIESLAVDGASRVVGTADSEEEAVSGILDCKPDAVVLDIQLREGNGFNVLRRLNDTLPLASRPLVIMLTNHNTPSYCLRAYAAGTDYFLDKASEFDQLSKVIAEFAGKQPHL
jgi:DNA-binding NarL/FixJ family response regulator